MTVLDADLLEMLRKVDTPTVCNAIETAQGARGFDGFTRRTVLSAGLADKPIVGFARTAKIAGAEPPPEGPDATRARRMEYFRYMDAGPRPAIAVIEDLDYPDCIAAWWGEVHTAVHKGLGIEGALTNGVMRDLGNLEPGFPVIAGSIGPSHACCHIRDIGAPAEVFGLSIRDGDLVHADRHGAVVVPAALLPDLGAALAELRANEQLILGAAREAGFDIEALERAWRDFEKARI